MLSGDHGVRGWNQETWEKANTQGQDGSGRARPRWGLGGARSDLFGWIWKE